jgi:hypothetical protein
MDETLAKALEILRLAALNARGEVGYSHVGSPNQSSEGWPAIKFAASFSVNRDDQSNARAVPS